MNRDMNRVVGLGRFLSVALDQFSDKDWYESLVFLTPYASFRIKTSMSHWFFEALGQFSYKNEYESLVFRRPRPVFL